MKAMINGIQMGYDVIGEEGMPMVLIHGFGLDRSIWEEVTKKYLIPHRVILPDVRGHGESDAPEGAYPMALLAEDIKELLDFLKIEKAAVCGHSMGGYITLAFAERYPERLAGLGLITTRTKADSAEQRADRYQMVEKVREYGAIVLAESLGPKLTKNEAVFKESYKMLSNTDPLGIIGVLQGMAERPDRRELLSKITVPALVVAGDQDQIIDLGDARQMADTLPRARFHLVSGAGHMPMLEKPEDLASGLEWLISEMEKM